MRRSPYAVVAAICLGLWLGIGAVAPSQELPDGLVGYWTFDDGAGSLAADELGGNPGVLNGPIWVDGRVGGALSFDGTDDWVDFGASSDFALYPPFSLEFWLYPRSTGSWVISKGDSSYRYFSFAFLSPGIPPGPELHFWVETAGADSVGTELTTDRWYHVVGIHDGEDLSLWIDRSLVASIPSEPWDFRSNSRPLLAGIDSSYFYHADKWFDGLLDEMAIYDRALTFDEIEVHYYNGLAGRGLSETGMDHIWVPNTISFHHRSGADEVLADEAVTSRVELSTGAINWSEWQDPVLEAPVLTLTTPLGVDWVEPGEHLVPGSEYRWEFPDLPSDGSLNIQVGLDPDTEPITFLPGFNLTRTVIEPVIETPGGEQTVIVTITQEEGQLDGVGLSSWVLQVWGGWDYPHYDAFPTSFVADPQLDCGMTTNYVYCIDWNPGAPRTYQVEVTFDVGVYDEWHQVEYVPTVQVQADFGCCDEVPVATSLDEATEYGTWTWETGEPRLWHSQYVKRKWVELESRVEVLNRVPVPECRDIEVVAGPDCSADVSIDAGSWDPDGDAFVLEQDPPPPYIPISTGVRLTITDEHGASDFCHGEVIVLGPDLDGDLWDACDGGDCDDADPTTYPGAEELCDGKDNDCNGVVDDVQLDGDGDGDAVADCPDNCPATFNPGQEDWNGDGAGDVCQDFDDDGLNDETEIVLADETGCPFPDNSDSDFDTLLDGTETAAGTDPCNADTDDDGIDDAVDPLPTEPGVTGDWLEEELRSLAQTIRGLDLVLFEGRTDPGRRARRTVLAQRFHLASKAVRRGNLHVATLRLQSASRRLDGVSPPPDFMVESPQKTSLFEINVLYLELLDLM